VFVFVEPALPERRAENDLNARTVPGMPWRFVVALVGATTRVAPTCGRAHARDIHIQGIQVWGTHRGAPTRGAPTNFGPRLDPCQQRRRGFVGVRVLFGHWMMATIQCALTKESSACGC
jgi:hypothetical protein